VRFPPYPAYKPSGVQWLGDVPAHWSVRRLKFSARYSVSNVDKVPSEDELPVRLCNYTDVYNNERIQPEMGLMETTATADEIRRFGLQVGDVLLTKDSEEWTDIGIPALVERSAPDLVCGYHLAIVRANERLLLGPFLLRLLQSLPVNRHFQVAADGVTRFGLPKSAIGDAWLPLPPPNEQAMVAGFIDRETEKIDALVEKKRALVERLTEKRAALISRTVTHGLPPDAARAAGLDPQPKLKASGITCLGDVPQHWQVSQLRRLCTVLDCKHRTVPFVEGGIPVASIREVHDFEVDLEDAKKTTEEEYRVMIEGGRDPRIGDIIFSRNATVGDAAIVAATDRFCMGQDVCLIRAPRHHGRFLLYIFRSTHLSEQVESLMIGSTFRRINVEQIKAFWVCMPPLREQQAIVAFLDHESAKIDRLVRKVEEAIEGLLEYRSALITAAVTGKIDVRGIRGIPTESGGTLQP
jgi:type I restriction enzyme S subunit